MSSRVDAPSQDVRPPRRPFLIIVTLVIMGLSAGGIWAAWRILGHHAAGGAVPLIHADTRPVKVPPADPGGLSVPDEKYYVLNGRRPADSRIEQLLPPPEQPLPRPAPAEPTVTETAPAAAALNSSAPAAAVSGSAAHVAAPADSAPSAAPAAARARSAPTAAPAAPPVALSKSAPAETEAMASPPAAAALSGSAPAAAPAAPAVALGSTAPSTAPAAERALSAPEGVPAAPAVALGESAPEETQAMESPAPASALAASAPPEPAKATNPGTAASAAATSTKPARAGYRLQIGALRSEEAAQAEWARLRRANSDILGPLEVRTVRADLGARGIFYRLEAGPIAEETVAARACDTLKERKVGCILVRP